MKKVHKRTDFTHQFSFCDIDRLLVGPLTTFTMTFHSEGGADHKSFKCENGIPDSELLIDNDTITVVFNSPSFSGGQLSLDFDYKLPDSTFTDGWRDKRCSVPINVTIIAHGTGEDDDRADLIVLEYAKNVKQDIVINGIDLSKSGRNKVAGLFWPSNADGTPKQVYHETITGNIPPSIPKNAATWLRFTHTTTHLIAGGVEQVQYAAGGIEGIKPYDTTYPDADMYGYEPGSVGILLYFQNATPDNFCG